jgi:hypothetical protein
MLVDKSKQKNERREADPVSALVAGRRTAKGGCE